MAARESISNNTQKNLARLGIWTGVPDSVAEFTSVGISVLCDCDISLTVYQNMGGLVQDSVSVYTIPATSLPTTQDVSFQAPRIILPLSHRFLVVSAQNLSTTNATTYLRIATQVFNTDTRDSITALGANSNFVFYPTPANNTVAIYADGIKGTNVTGGWQYTSSSTTAPTNKINWYLYSSTSPSTDYPVSALTSMYTVINNISTQGALAQHPYIIVYTRPTGTGDATTWYKSKLFYGNNTTANIASVKLLYTGTDPIGIHPEITDRVQLVYNESLSTHPLAQVQSERIMLGSLQTTNNTTPNGAYDFVMQEFGGVWVKEPTPLPIEFGKLQVGGTLGMTNIYNGQTFTYASITGASWVSDTMDLRNCSIMDICLAAGTVSTASAMVFKLQASPDGYQWFDTGASLSLTPSSLKTYSASQFLGAPYIRLAYSTSVILDIATNIVLGFLTKSF